MKYRTGMFYGLAGALLLSSTGCIVIAGGGWGFGCSKTVWTETTTERFSLDAGELSALEVRTHNGSISFQSQPADGAEAFVIVTKKAGGRTQAAAQEAMEALEVFVEPAGAGAQRIGSRWQGIKHSDWRKSVSFEIHAPGNLRLDVQTRNGSVKIEGVSGDVKVVTHNGRINVESSGGSLYARTHNGGIVASYAGEKVSLKTHNGRIVADLNRCEVLDGTIETHNGRIEVVVGDETSVMLTARTRNGSLSCRVPLTESEATRHRLTGRIGAGQGSLAVTTHNGSVRVKKATG